MEPVLVDALRKFVFQICLDNKLSCFRILWLEITTCGLIRVKTLRRRSRCAVNWRINPLPELLFIYFFL